MVLKYVEEISYNLRGKCGIFYNNPNEMVIRMWDHK